MSWIIHSAKGSEWKKHKYLKRVNGTYYYPDNYPDGRHISDLKGGNEKSDNSDDPIKTIVGTGENDDSDGGNLSEKDLENLANEVIRGNFGNGEQRKELLGEYYQEIQDLVNQKLKGGSGSNKKSYKKDASLKGKGYLVPPEIANKSKNPSNHKVIKDVDYIKQKKEEKAKQAKHSGMTGSGWLAHSSDMTSWSIIK